jgi:hypothetical protein
MSQPSVWSPRRSRPRSLVCEPTRPATSRTSTTTSSWWSLRATQRRPSTECTGSSRKSATSSSRLVLLRLRGWKSRLSSRRGSSSRGRNRSRGEPFAVPTSTSRTSTDLRTGPSVFFPSGLELGCPGGPMLRGCGPKLGFRSYSPPYGTASGSGGGTSATSPASTRSCVRITSPITDQPPPRRLVDGNSSSCRSAATRRCSHEPDRQGDAG